METSSFAIRNPRFSNRGQAMSEDILLDTLTRLLGFPQAPDRPPCARSNTPAAWLFRSLPVAYFYILADKKEFPVPRVHCVTAGFSVAPDAPNACRAGESLTMEVERWPALCYI